MWHQDVYSITQKFITGRAHQFRILLPQLSAIKDLPLERRKALPSQFQTATEA